MQRPYLTKQVTGHLGTYVVRELEFNGYALLGNLANNMWKRIIT